MCKNESPEGNRETTPLMLLSGPNTAIRLGTDLIVGPAGLGEQVMRGEEILIAPDQVLLSAPQPAPLEVPHQSSHLRILQKCNN